MSNFVGKIYVAQEPGLEPTQVSIVVENKAKIYRATWRNNPKMIVHGISIYMYEIEVTVDGDTWKHLAWEPNEDKMWATLMRFVTNK